MLVQRVYIVRLESTATCTDIRYITGESERHACRWEMRSPSYGPRHDARRAERGATLPSSARAISTSARLVTSRGRSRGRRNISASSSSAGVILERCEVMVSGVLVAPKATAYHHITNEMLAESGIPLEGALGHLSAALHALEADGGVLVGHNLTFV